MNGSPARAGIDPLVRLKGEEGFRFPRTRGDRPFPSLTLWSRIWVPPHARG